MASMLFLTDTLCILQKILPTGFEERHFTEVDGKPYHGSSEGIDLDYFLQKEESKM